MTYTYAAIAKMIDHSLLNPSLTDEDMAAGCLLARECDVASAIVLPHFLPRAVGLLAGSGVAPSTTVGFPHGGHSTATKIAEAREAISSGARELDMVVNVSKVRSHDWTYVRQDIAAINDLCHAQGVLLKVIFENAYLTRDEKVRLCEICGELGVDWVKTSTGYAPSGATKEDVVLMRQHSPAEVQIKAAGGIRDLDLLLEYRALGITRLGASATKAILDETRKRLAGRLSA